MANLGNTIVNGALRVNGKINSSDVISAPSFVGALTGNADTATKLKTARTINGTSFDGSGNITTANWGTARNIGIVNSDGTGTAVTVSVNGSGNINLKLPATIKAALTGNAATATKLATARTINGVSFDGSANITVADSTKLPLTGGTLTGKVKLYNSDASTGLQSGQLTIGSTNSAYNGSTGGGDVAIELWRGTNASWQILNNGGYLYFKNNYTTAIQSSYSQVALKMNYNTGDATFYGNISPDANNTGTLGTSSMKWNNVYATTFTGALSGNATSATTSTKLSLPRVSEDANTNYGISLSIMKEYTNSAKNIPSAHYYHILTGESQDDNYSTQLALGMTTNRLAYRYKSGGNWTSWNTVYTTGNKPTKSDVGLGNVDNTSDANKSVASATRLTTARTIGVSGVTGTAQSFNGTANIVIPITAVPSTLLTNKSAIKGSEITNDKHWVPSSDASVTNFVSMTAEEYATNASSLATGTIVAITDGVEGYVTTQATSLTCDLPLDL